MGSVYWIPKVVLEDRLDCSPCPGRLENTDVRIGMNDYKQTGILNPLCFLHDFVPATKTLMFPCDAGPMEGKFVQARKVGPTNRPGEWSKYAWAIREFRVWVFA